jgi:protein PhnA
MVIEEKLLKRANYQCELCKNSNNLTLYSVPKKTESEIDFNQSILICSICNEQLNDDTKIDTSHWHCLNDSMWSEQNAVKVVAYRMLKRLKNQDLLDILYLEDDILSWANEESDIDDEPEKIKKDANGNILNAGDSITILKDLDVKGSSIVAKRGTVVKNIKISNVSDHIEGKINGTSIYLKCAFIKKI